MTSLERDSLVEPDERGLTVLFVQSGRTLRYKLLKLDEVSAISFNVDDGHWRTTDTGRSALRASRHWQEERKSYKDQDRRTNCFHPSAEGLMVV